MPKIIHYPLTLCILLMLLASPEVATKASMMPFSPWISLGSYQRSSDIRVRALLRCPGVWEAFSEAPANASVGIVVLVSIAPNGNVSSRDDGKERDELQRC
ncbi:hypothetical protein BDV10DRAFT_121884 [Aspergillus recurvatus]